MATRNKHLGWPQILLITFNSLFFFFIGVFANNIYVQAAFTTGTPTILSPKKAVLKNALMWIEPPKIIVSKNNNFEIAIFLDGRNQVINGIDAVLTYDETILKVESITPETASLVFPRKKTEDGRILLTAVKQQPDDIPFSTLKLATISLKPLKTSQTALNFEFAPDKTTASNIIKAHGSENILGKVKGTRIEIQ